MTKYDDLRSAFSKYKDAERSFVDENEKLARLIVNGLSTYLGIPDTFEHRVGEVIHYKSYLPFFRINDDESTEEELSLSRAISHFSDGSFRFAFGVTLEVAEATFPKQSLILHVKCKRRGKKVAVDVSGCNCEVTFDGNTCPEIEVLHNKIFALLMEWLQHRPGDGSGLSKFGFTVN